MSWPKRVGVGISVVLIVLCMAASNGLGYMQGKSDLDRWFRDQNFVRIHVPVQCEEGIR